jgi:acyl-CoA synthetase (NDP forming)
VPLAEISDATRAAVQDVLDPGLVAENPLDAWGTGIDADRIFRDAFLRLHDDPDTAAMAFVVDLTRQGEPYDGGYLGVASDVWDATRKPFCILSNLASAVATEEAAWLRDRGIPVLEGTESGLRALRHLLDDRDARERPPARAPESVPADVRDRWRARLGEGGDISEQEALRLLADYGVPTVATREAATLAEAIDAAEDLGWPVALKTAEPGIQHKSDVGGVHLGLADAGSLRAAYEDLAARIGPRALVSTMAGPGVEMALGIVRDPQFGALVVVAAGGILVELLRDRRLAMPPVDEPHAHRLLDGLRTRSLLDGMRGGPRADVDALARAIARLSVIAQDLGEQLEAMDVNPLIVSPSGCQAADALIFARTRP